MGSVAAIDGVTGPGRRTLLFQEGVDEITFRLKKKVIEITNSRGEMGSYDLAQVTSIDVSSDGDNFTIAVSSVPVEETNERTRKDDERAKTTYVPGSEVKGTGSSGEGKNSKKSS